MKTIEINNTSLISSATNTKLNQSVVTSDTTLPVYSIKDFVINTPILIGSFGSEGAEIINTHDTTTPVNNTITLASALVKDHYQDTIVYQLSYDQVELSHAETILGSKSIIKTETINPEEEYFVLTDDTKSSGYYFIRHKNSITGTYSTYSDPIPYNGYEKNTVGFVIAEVTEDLGVSLDEKITHTMLINALNRMMRQVRGRINKWSDTQKFNTKLAQVEYGKLAYDLPEDIYTTHTNRSIKHLRIGSNIDLTYIDKTKYDEIVKGQKHTQVKTQAEIGDTSITLDSTADLDDSGTINIFVSDVKYSITYTSNDWYTNILSGVPDTGTGSITVTTPVDSDAWDNATYADHKYYTVFNEKIHLPYIASSDIVGKNIYIDYWVDIEEVDSDGDVLKMPRYDMAYFYLKAFVRANVENNGVMDKNDPDYQTYLEITETAIQREHTGQRRRKAPRVNGITY